MMTLVIGLTCLVVGIGAGWYLNGKFGTKIDTIAGDVKKL